MTEQSITQAPLVYNNKSIPEVYWAIKHVHGDIVQITPTIVLSFIPKDTCPQQWARSLRNYKYNLSKPKSKKRRRRSAGTGPRSHNPGLLVLSQLEVVS